MADADKDKQFLSDNKLDDDEIFVEVSANPPKPPWQERLPSGYDPMGEIQLRGRAYRGLAGGRIPWWVLISGWIIFGTPVLLILITAIATKNFVLLTVLIIPSILLIILWRGTVAKLSMKKRRR